MQRALSLALKGILPTIVVFVGLSLFENAWVSLFGYHGLILIALISLRSSYAKNSQVVKDHSNKSPELWLYLAHFTMPILTYYSLVGINAVFSLDSLVPSLNEIGLNRHQAVPFAIYLCIINGTLEELYWRKLGPYENYVISLNDLFYALFHLPVLILYFPKLLILPIIIVLYMAGYIWRKYYKVTGRIRPSVLSHVACNFAIWLWVYQFLSAQ